MQMQTEGGLLFRGPFCITREEEIAALLGCYAMSNFLRIVTPRNIGNNLTNRHGVIQQ